MSPICWKDSRNQWTVFKCNTRTKTSVTVKKWRRGKLNNCLTAEQKLLLDLGPGRVSRHGRPCSYAISLYYIYTDDAVLSKWRGWKFVNDACCPCRWCSYIPVTLSANGGSGGGRVTRKIPGWVKLDAMWQRKGIKWNLLKEWIA